MRPECGAVPDCPVHPHARGDNCRVIGWRHSWHGSPPRAWGQYQTGMAKVACHRFTPTRVGTMAVSVPSAARGTVHPHARGDNRPDPLAAVAMLGSPPRAWGQFCELSRGYGQRRFTPTRVGTIRDWAAGYSWMPVHPHARGDNAFSNSLCADSFGSPPRAWGQSGSHASPLHGNRFTPTRVGTISTSLGKTFPLWVHPHARGDNFSGHHSGATILGSPPRAWGQLPINHLTGRRDRFTPTRVGTIRLPPREPRPSPVHPHARGDNLPLIRQPKPVIGSPPRAWGQWLRPC